MSIKLNSVGGGSVTIAEPNTASDFTLSVPAQTGTVVASDSSGNVGIGTATPSGFKLFVSGGRTTLNSADDYALRIGKNGTYGAYIGSNAADVLNFYDSTGNEGFRLNNQTLQMNNGYGSIATFYGCRAWVKFDATSGTPTIQASGNVSSITDVNTGRYTVNLTNAMPDANYAVSIVGAASVTGMIPMNGNNNLTYNNTTTSFNMVFLTLTSSYPDGYVSACVFR